MKKIINSVLTFLKAIWKIIDKFIVIPISKLAMTISRRFDASGKNIENWLSKPNTLLFISLFLAVIIFITIDQKILSFSESSAEVLKNQVVNVTYNEEAYVVEGIPETVDITLIGRRAELIFAKQSSNNNVNIDLTGLKPGTHRVNITYKHAMPSIDYSVNPAVATVVIYPKVSEMKILTIDLLNQDTLSDKLIISDVEMTTDRVIIKGAEYKLKQVAAVKALVDVKNLLSYDVGTTTLKDIPLMAYDNKGQIVDVEIVPSKIDATITIESPSKELPIRVIPKGDIGFGKAISAIDMSETKVKVYGTKEILDDLNYIDVEINVDGLKENREFKKELVKPVGIRSMDISNVTISVSLDNSTDREISGINIVQRNINDIYTGQAVSQEDAQVVVALKGVESVISTLNSDDITAYVDLSGLGEGIHDVEVKVEVNDARVSAVVKTKKVKIRIIKKQ